MEAENIFTHPLYRSGNRNSKSVSRLPKVRQLEALDLGFTLKSGKGHQNGVPRKGWGRAVEEIRRMEQGPFMGL